MALFADSWAVLNGSKRRALAEQKRQAEEADAKRQEDERRLKAAAEAKRQVEEKKLEEEAEARRQVTFRKEQVEIESLKVGILVYRKCQYEYPLDQVATMSDDEMFGILGRGGATVIRATSNIHARGPVMVGRLRHDGNTSEGDLRTLLTLSHDPRGRWQCRECQAIDTWHASYRQSSLKPASSTPSASSGPSLGEVNDLRNLGIGLTALANSLELWRVWARNSTLAERYVKDANYLAISLSAVGLRAGLSIEDIVAVKMAQRQGRYKIVPAVNDGDQGFDIIFFYPL